MKKFGGGDTHSEENERKLFEEFVKEKGGPDKIGSREIAEWISSRRNVIFNPDNSLKRET